MKITPLGPLSLTLVTVMIVACAGIVKKTVTITNFLARVNDGVNFTLSLPDEEQLAAESVRVKYWMTTLPILAVLSATLALAEDFQTINGKVYKDATISRVEADGIMLRTKTGISKIYFVELPKDVQERFHYQPPKPVVTPRERQPMKVEAKKDESRKTDQGGWAGGLLLSGVFLRALVFGTLIITTVVIAIVRGRYL